MRSLAILVTLLAAAWIACAQGSGAPSPVGQSITPQAASAAERAVESRHKKAEERSKSRAAKRAARSASAQGD
jgi:hypothetical protein